MTAAPATMHLLLTLLDGASSANALRRNGKPCRIPLPDDLAFRVELVEKHLRGASATLTFCAEGHGSWQECVDTVVVAGFCPAGDGQCRWIGIDVDAADHGERGLADPVQATRCIAERISAAGLLSGLVVARSRRGVGRHVFLILPGPTPLHQAVIGLAAITASAFNVAASDVKEYGAHPAFRCANGAMAEPGDAGAVELLPRSTERPQIGWALTLPAAGAFREQGGGIIVDPFSDAPVQLECQPKCDPKAWSLFIAEARAALSQRTTAGEYRRRRPPVLRHARAKGNLRDRIDPRTQAFLQGHATKGSRNNSAFAASINLLGCGAEPNEVERLVLDGAAACRLPEREARSAFQFALKTFDRKPRTR